MIMHLAQILFRPRHDEHVEGERLSRLLTFCLDTLHDQFGEPKRVPLHQEVLNQFAPLMLEYPMHVPLDVPAVTA